MFIRKMMMLILFWGYIYRYIQTIQYIVSPHVRKYHNLSKIGPIRPNKKNCLKGNPTLPFTGETYNLPFKMHKIILFPEKKN